MTVFQLGDKVRDNRIGTVVNVSDPNPKVVSVDYGDPAVARVHYRSELLELVERPTPPVKVGDEVTPENYGRLTQGTAVRAVTGGVFVLNSRGRWDMASPMEYQYGQFEVEAGTILHLPLP